MSKRRPQRATVDFLNQPISRTDDSHTAKKARFDARNPSTLATADAEDEDPILNLDEIGSKGAQAKRGAVELDGYESDSSNENFDQRAAARNKVQTAAKSKTEEDNDMFAELEEDMNGGVEDDDDDNAKKKRKEVNFMDSEDIVGQDSTSKGGGHVSVDYSLNGKGPEARDREVEESSDESGDDETRAQVGEDVDEIEMGAGAKKKHAPKLDAFNMKNETDEGKFDESGNFIRNAADPFAIHDSWLEGSSKAQMKRAREAEQQREEERRRRDIEDDAVSTAEVLGQLISRLQEGETILEALARLNSKDKKPKWQKGRRKDAMDVDVAVDPAETKRREDVEAITAAADRLLTLGQAEIYEAERALLLRQYRRETGSDYVEAEGRTTDEQSQWEYRWSDARDGGDTHGPYDGKTMIAWNEAGYFGEGVEFRRVGEEDWSRSVEFV